MADQLMYEKAASCYYQARLVADAVRCYRLAGAHRRAADLSASLGDYREAAVDYERSGLPELAAWLLVHHAQDPDAARAVLTRLTAVAARKPPASGAPAHDLPLSLRHRLVLARCAVAESEPPSRVLPVIDDACAELADVSIPFDRFTEEWAVIVASNLQRYDRVALIFAASVRGFRRGAAQRWKQWAARVLGAELTIPDVAGMVRLSWGG